jgi:hypothetical protein
MNAAALPPWYLTQEKTVKTKGYFLLPVGLQSVFISGKPAGTYFGLIFFVTKKSGQKKLSQKNCHKAVTKKSGQKKLSQKNCHKALTKIFLKIKLSHHILGKRA